VGTSTYAFEGTNNALTGNMSSGYGTFTKYVDPSDSISYFKITTGAFAHGASSGVALPDCKAATYYCTTVSGTVYMRGYFRLNSAPTADFGLFRLFASSYTKSHVVGITTTRRFFAAAGRFDADTYISGASSSWDSGTNNTVPLSEWFRYEVALSATTVRAQIWKASGAGIDSSGTADYDSGTLTVSSIGTLDDARMGFESVAGGVFQTFLTPSTGSAWIDDAAVSDAGWIGPVGTNATAAPSITATGAAVGAATRVLAGSPSITATGAATAGKVLTASGAPSITAAGAADASVITTHNAEAAGSVTVSSSAATTLTRPINAAATLTASAVATMANQTSADGIVQAIGAARIVIEGETSPGFLYSTVAKNVLTS